MDETSLYIILYIFPEQQIWKIDIQLVLLMTTWSAEVIPFFLSFIVKSLCILKAHSRCFPSKARYLFK